METFLNSYNLDHEEQFHVTVLLLEKGVEWNHSYGVYQESRLDVSFGDFGDVSYFIVLILWLELEQKFYI